MNYCQSYHILRSHGQTFLESFEGIGQNLRFHKGDYIEYDLEKKDYCYLILRGRVKQYFIEPNGRERIVLLLKKGDFFGEVNMIQNNIDLVISAALTGCEVKRISRSELESAFRSDPELALKFIQMQTTKVRLFLFQIQDAAFCDIKNRLKNLLIRLAIQYGIPGKEKTYIDFGASHEEIAKMIGSTRSTVTKILAELTQEGFIEIKNKAIYIGNQFLDF